MQRIALYGGTFDPVHAGHMAVARRLLDLFALDRVLFIPAHVAPHKRRTAVTPGLHRYAMLALATQDEERFHLSTVELDAPERPFTIDTLQRLRQEAEAATRFFFVMGADSWEEITSWREWERLLTLTDHIVVARPGYELGAAHVTAAIRDRIVDARGARMNGFTRPGGDEEGTKIYFTDAVQMNISSTQIRAAVRNGQMASVISELPPPVAGYIEKYGLYKERHEKQISRTRTDATH
jgi:nicotinate-nucleotide adenylyltransferase